MSKAVAADVRESLVAALEADLVGPFDGVTGDETLQIPPSRWYLAGFLAPSADRERDEDPTDNEELAAGDDEDDGELAPAEPEPKKASRAYTSSSIGMSLLLRPGPESDVLNVTVQWADYEPIEAPSDQGQLVTLTGGRKTPSDRLNWMRRAHAPVDVPVPLSPTVLAKGKDVEGSGGLRLEGRLETTNAPGLKPGTRALAIFLVNRRPAAAEKREADKTYVFQVSMEAAFAGGLEKRPNHQHELAEDPDDRISDLQYRNHGEYAVGHGVSVHTRRDEDGVYRTARTAWIPSGEVRRVITFESDKIETQMEALSALPDAAAVDTAIGGLTAEYGAWIDAQTKMNVGDGQRAAVQQELVKNAKRAMERIAHGIALLKTDPQVFQAFKLANQAMATQQRQRARTEEDKARTPKWRLFQLAFVLLNLPSVADGKHPDRDVAELIFFPTGGGKTEAYLGVIAFALVLRRIRRRHLPDEGLGVAIILRYTLRLLTLDQLSRAATLICALEMMRRAAPEQLGTVRFTVGLWVGRKATANRLSEVAKQIVDFKGSTTEKGSPFPLTECPWCQTPLQKRSFDIVPKPSRPEAVVVSCVEAACPFSPKNGRSGLPVLFVDEQVYRELPSFLVSTVDKFAMLPWRAEAGKLFGRVLARDDGIFLGPADGKVPKGVTLLPDGLLPPELIVQDELHLISGPLGTMVGLYETAVETLCTRTEGGREVKPKILASTATVKRAREQVRALFGRSDLAVFPPPGVDPQETFFSRVQHDEAGRLYVGVSAGRANKAVMRRVYIVLLAAAQKAYDARLGGNQAADAYMTLVGYFNTLRELGGMRRLVDDEVRHGATQVEARKPVGFEGRHPWAQNRQVREPVELTSREKTADIADHKARMTLPHAAKEHVDVVLASNMISVGVDIERLGLMVVAGQPKSTNEYIQATSRVGRRADRPGLVVTVFNPSRPRDRSHYEHFTAYHGAFYRYVEATSVTPFSGPALQRGLAAVLVAMARHVDGVMAPSAAVMDLAKHRKLADEMVQVLANRGAQSRLGVPHDEVEKLRASLKGRGMNILDSWQNLMAKANTEEAGDRCYSPWDVGKKGKALLTQAGEEQETLQEDERKFVAATSMRDVEGVVHLWVKRVPLA